MLVTNTYDNDSRVRREAESLVRLGHCVTVLCMYSRATPRRNAVVEGVRIVRVAREARDIPGALFGAINPRGTTAARGTGRARGRLVSAARQLALPALMIWWVIVTWKFLRVASRLHVDVCHSHDADTLVAAYLAARRVGSFLVHDAHEYARYQAGHSSLERWRDHLSLTALLRKCDAVMTVSEELSSALVRAYRLRRRPSVIHNYPRTPTVSHKTPGIRDLAAIPDNVSTVLHLGIMSPERGLLNLVEAMRYLPNAHLVLVGDSVRGMEAKIRSRAVRLGLEHRLTILPPVPSHWVVALAAGVDVGVTLLQPGSKNHEVALPNKLFEYAQAGIPVVASDLPAIRRTVTNHHLGRLCDPQDPEAIAGAISEALEKVDRVNLGARAELSWEAEEIELFAEYERLSTLLRAGASDVGGESLPG